MGRHVTLTGRDVDWTSRPDNASESILDPFPENGMNAPEIINLIEQVGNRARIPVAPMLGPRIDVGQVGGSVASGRIVLYQTIERGNVDERGRPCEEWARSQFHVAVKAIVSTNKDYHVYASSECLRSAVFTFFSCVVTDAVAVAFQGLDNAAYATLTEHSD